MLGKMTVQEDAKEDSCCESRKPKLANISTKGLFASLRERGEEFASTPDSTTPKSRTGFFASTPKTPGTFASTPKTPGPLSPTVPSLIGLNVVAPLKNKLLTPSRTFSRLRDEREELSRLTPSPPSQSSFREGFSLPLVGEVKPMYLLQLAKEWLWNPKNLALLIWGVAVGVSGAILFMVMVGMLDAVLPTRNSRNIWFEVSNQIINALFTLMAVYLHPQRCLHLHMLWRWSASDIVKLRNIYCKGGTRKPHEWAHMLVVVMLMQLNCFAQYALCGLNWGYRRANRPAIGVAICLCLSLGGAAGAGIYNTLSPLGRDFETDPEDMAAELSKEGSDSHVREFSARTKFYKMLERRKSFACREEGSIVEKPEWKGGVFDCTSDPPVSLLSSLCCLCVFGWNMDRLGFGNRYVHIVTFVLLLTAPYWIFDLAALNIQNRVVRNSIAGTGIVLCAFGLLYGGFWRIKMRERFNLPRNGCCCGRANVTDCFQWLFFPVCSLCQEVRTAEAYEVKDDKFYTRAHRAQASPPLSSPPPGFPSPRTPGPTLAGVNGTPSTLDSMIFADVELSTHDSPFRESKSNPLAAPKTVIASRDGTTVAAPAVLGNNGNGVAMGPSPQDPGLAPNNPFLYSELAGRSPNNNPFLRPDLVSVPESPPRTSTSNPFLQPKLYSREGSPVRSPHRLHTSHNPFTPDVSFEGGAPAVRSPLRSVRSADSFHTAFSPPEVSSSPIEYTASPPRTASSSLNPLAGYTSSPPRTASSSLNPSAGYTSSPPRTASSSLNPLAGYTSSPPGNSPSPLNPFLQQDPIISSSEVVSNSPNSATNMDAANGESTSDKTLGN